MRVYCDGSGWNGESSGYAIVFDSDTKPILIRNGENKTNNEREYEAVIEAAKMSFQAEIVTDSQLVVNQVNGSWKVKEIRLLHLCREAQRLIRENQCTLKWVRREENKAGFLF